MVYNYFRGTVGAVMGRISRKLMLNFNTFWEMTKTIIVQYSGKKSSFMLASNLSDNGNDLAKSSESNKQ